MTTSSIKPGQRIWIAKSQMLRVPQGFEESPLGELKGAIKQYRGPDNLHLREYDDGWELHQDHGDPRTLGGFIIHIFFDTPEVGLALLSAIGTYKKKYEETESVVGSMGESIRTGILTYVGLKVLKEFLERFIQRPSDY